MARRVDAIVFDMDGTLFDSKAVVPDSYLSAVRGLGGPVYTPQQIIDAYSVGPPRAMLRHLMGRDLEEADLELYYTALERSAGRVEVYAGMRDALEQLARGVPLAVYSGASTRACRILLEGSDLAEFFAVILGADEVAHPKPAPDGIVEACRRLGVDPAASAYVGDAPYDLEAARRSSAMAVAAGWGHMFSSDTPADVVVRRPWDLRNLVGGPDADDRSC
jgi:HAD superfamily hydrolase (TIGR01549 family)